MNNALKSLKKYVGNYQGRGRNHEGEQFEGFFELTEIALGAGYQIKFLAQSLDRKTIFHSEASTLSPTMSGEIAMFNLNSNTPFLCEHKMIVNEIRDQHLLFKFRFGNMEDKNSFREEICLEVLNKTIKYIYSWGLPAGEFAQRSEVTMSFIDSKTD